MDRASRQTQAVNQQSKLAKKIKNFIYHPTDLIGSGFSSQVFKGINQIQTDSSKKNVAVKVIELSKIQNQVQNYLLNNQVNALKLLKHPNILQTIDILMTKNNVYIVTQFCQGGDMLKYIKNNGPFTQLKAMSLIKGILQGYKCVQQNRIIHRDIKTSNIFISQDQAKIADFGFCQFVGQKKPQIAYNVGSPAYMSPQSYKQNQYSHKSDIWSIGIVLYQMLVGETPDRSLTYTQMANNLMSGKIKGVQNQQIRKILTLCFKKSLKQRIDAISLCQLITLQLSRLQIQNSNSSNTTPTLAYYNGQNNMKISGIPPNRNVSPTKAKDIKFLKAQVPSNLKQLPTNNMPTNKLNQNGIPEQQPKKSFIKQPQKANILKPHTEYLLFLYRLLKFIVQIKIDKISQILLSLFRHRNVIETNVEQVYQVTGPQIQQYYKQFQYLKIRFDQVYLQYSKQNSSKKNIYKQKLDSLINLPFTHPQALNFYCLMIREVCSQCLLIMDNRNQNLVNKSQIGIILDYLIIWFQLLGLHAEGHSIAEIINISKLQNIVKEQPKKLSPGHIELLKFKYNRFINNVQSQNGQYSNPNTQNNITQSPQPGVMQKINQNSSNKQSQQRARMPVQVVSSFVPQQTGTHMNSNIVQINGGSGVFSYPGLSQIPINQSITMPK